MSLRQAILKAGRTRNYIIASAMIAVGVLGLYPRPSAAKSMTNVTISLNWLKNVEFGGLWVAQQKGWWAQGGLNVTADPYASTDPTLLVGTGKDMFGFQDGASLIIARSKGIPVKAVWASVQKSPFAFITMPGSGITSVKGFKGKRIGYQAHQRYVLETMLNHAGLTMKDVQPVVVGFDPTLLVAGKIDAYLAFLTNEPIELQQKDHLKVNIIPASDYGYDFYSDVLFTTDSLIKSNPGLVRQVVAIMDRGWKYALSHSSETAHIVVPKLDNNDSVSQQEAEMKALTPLASAYGAPVGTMTTSRWRDGVSILLKYKEIDASLPTSAVYTTRFLPVTH